MTRWFPNGMPQPMANKESLPFWQAAAEHKLVVQRCNQCEHMQLPPSPLCSECRCDDMHFHEVSGRGEVYTYTTVHRPIAMDQKVPFIVAVIALEGAGGVRMISNIVEIEPEELEIGMPVRVAWEDMSDDMAIPRFKRA